MWGWILCAGLGIVMAAYTSGDHYEHTVERSDASRFALESTNRCLRTAQLLARASASAFQDVVVYLDKVEAWWHTSTHMYVNKTLKPTRIMSPPPEN